MPQFIEIVLRTPPGITAEPAVFEGTVGPESTTAFPVRLHAARDAADGLRIVAFDITRDGVRYGELFDFIAYVGDIHEEVPGPVGTEKPKY